MKSIYRLTRHINTYTSQPVFPIPMHAKQNMLIPGEDDHASENFER